MAAPSLAILAGMLSTASGAAQDSEMESQAASAESANSTADQLTEIKYSSDQGQAPYQVTFISISYRRSEGLVHMPGSSTEADICQESKPWGVKTVEWAVARLRHPPKLPSHEENDNEVLADEEVNAVAMSVMPDGVTPVYYRSGSLTYLFVTPPVMDSEELKSPKNPGLNVDTPPIKPDERESWAPPLDD